jgi:hypothetical protein
LEKPPEITAIAVNGGIGIEIGGGGKRDARVFGGFPSSYCLLIASLEAMAAYEGWDFGCGGPRTGGGSSDLSQIASVSQTQDRGQLRKRSEP